ncbi:TPA: hypothetical protein N0F65_006506 [Lagenidium giganteum]|uniref:CBS domain-containing protein n=1 Tax=Lagenidium giganteum TaxID=4803 RepID=A0AAV2YR35_9STRA|nr:TPA: hypothetical protein N0F65_006506 [Lagenidium giganteum]
MLARTFRVLQRRCISSTRPLMGGQTLVSNVVSSATVPTIDHLMSVDRALKVMAEAHVDALPVTKNAKCVGVFTEHDYFDKVLSEDHSATLGSPVEEAATMGPNLVVAHPEDTVDQCLEVMTNKASLFEKLAFQQCMILIFLLMLFQNLKALPVVEHDGHVLGTVSRSALTRELFFDRETQMMASQAIFSEPSHFPENATLPDGSIHDELTASNQTMSQLYDAIQEDLKSHMSMDSPAPTPLGVEPALEELAAEAFSESSAFPELTPAEDRFLCQEAATTVTPKMASDVFTMADAQQAKFAEAQMELLGKIDYFSEPSDFPECTPVEEVIQVGAK